MAILSLILCPSYRFEGKLDLLRRHVRKRDRTRGTDGSADPASGTLYADHFRLLHTVLENCDLDGTVLADLFTPAATPAELGVHMRNVCEPFDPAGVYEVKSP